MMFNEVSFSKDVEATNVLGTQLQNCSGQLKAGFYRTGKCQTGPDDAGVHAVCAVVNSEFLEFTKSRGNDLTTPNPASRFPGLKAGDRWCLCVQRWKEAQEANAAPKVILEATNKAVLKYASLEVLEKYRYKD
jgi:uncharacterized protein